MSRFSADSSAIPIAFVDPDGTRHAVLAPVAANLMRIARINGIDMHARCGGNLRCATCLIALSDTDAARIPAAGEAERALLAAVGTQVPNARLACRINIAPELSGIEIRIQVPAPKADRASATNS